MDRVCCCDIKRSKHRETQCGRRILCRSYIGTGQYRRCRQPRQGHQKTRVNVISYYWYDYLVQGKNQANCYTVFLLHFSLRINFPEPFGLKWLLYVIALCESAI
jgi:hypothetical protein